GRGQLVARLDHGQLPGPGELGESAPVPLVVGQAGADLRIDDEDDVGGLPAGDPAQGVDAPAAGQVVAATPERPPAGGAGGQESLLVGLAVVDDVPGDEHVGLDHELEALDIDFSCLEVVQPLADGVGPGGLFGVGREEGAVEPVPGLGQGEAVGAQLLLGG